MIQLQRKPRKGDRIGFGAFSGAGNGRVAAVEEPTKATHVVIRVGEAGSSDENLCWIHKIGADVRSALPFIWNFPTDGQRNRLARIFKRAPRGAVDDEQIPQGTVTLYQVRGIEGDETFHNLPDAMARAHERHATERGNIAVWSVDEYPCEVFGVNQECLWCSAWRREDGTTDDTTGSSSPDLPPAEDCEAVRLASGGIVGICTCDPRRAHP